MRNAGGLSDWVLFVFHRKGNAMSMLRQRSRRTDWDTLRKADEMDPQKTLYNLLDAIDRNDRVAVDELLEALRDWNAKGGFLPEVARFGSRDAAYWVKLKAEVKLVH